MKSIDCFTVSDTFFKDLSLWLLIYLLSILSVLDLLCFLSSFYSKSIRNRRFATALSVMSNQKASPFLVADLLTMGPPLGNINGFISLGKLPPSLNSLFLIHTLSLTHSLFHYLSISIPIYLPTFLSIDLSIYLSNLYLSIHLSLSLSLTYTHTLSLTHTHTLSLSLTQTLFLSYSHATMQAYSPYFLHSLRRSSSLFIPHFLVSTPPSLKLSSSAFNMILFAFKLPYIC